MVLNIVIDGQTLPIKVPQLVMEQGEEVFGKMNADMDRGWQMSRDWVDNPNIEQRCQIVADRILGAIESGNERVATMMAGYILKHAPGVSTVIINTTGEMQETELRAGEAP